MSGGHGHIEGSNKNIAILIAFLAAMLAICEMGAKSAQTTVLAEHVEASNLWGFYQAKTIRQTIMRTQAEAVEATYNKDVTAMPPGLATQVAQWKRTADRYESEPQTGKGEGRKELMARALAAEEKREVARGAYHMFEYGSAAFQLAIVLAGAAAVTSVMWLAFGAGALGGIGAVCMGLGFFAPTLLHALFHH